MAKYKAPYYERQLQRHNPPVLYRIRVFRVIERQATENIQGIPSVRASRQVLKHCQNSHFLLHFGIISTLVSFTCLLSAVWMAKKLLILSLTVRDSLSFSQLFFLVGGLNSLCEISVVGALVHFEWKTSVGHVSRVAKLEHSSIAAQFRAR